MVCFLAPKCPRWFFFLPQKTRAKEKTIDLVCVFALNCFLFCPNLGNGFVFCPKSVISYPNLGFLGILAKFMVLFFAPKIRWEEGAGEVAPVEEVPGRGF